jgi:hypothetical protein
MADTVSGQITDSVSSTNVEVVGDAPAQAMGSLYQSMAQAIGLAGGNAVTEQQQVNVTNQTSTTLGLSLLWSMGPTIGAKASVNIAK